MLHHPRPILSLVLIALLALAAGRVAMLKQREKDARVRNAEARNPEPKNPEPKNPEPRNPEPNEPTPIRAVPFIIDRPGNYRLEADLAYGGNGSPGDAIITVAVSNVVLDLNGHYLSGPHDQPGTALDGVRAAAGGNLVIKNGTIAFCRDGVHLTGDGSPASHNFNQRVENLLVTFCYHAGVELERVRNAEVRGCRVSFIGGADGETSGIACSGDGVLVRDNLVTTVTAAGGGEAYGINAPGEAGTFASGNTVTGCQHGVVAGKYRDNLTSGCQTAFGGGVDAGGNL